MSHQDGPPPPDPTSPVPTGSEPAASAKRRWWIVVGALVIAAIVVVIVVLIATGGDDDDSDPVAIGPAVAALQEDLTTLGYYDGPINGEYDTATQEAVKELQTASGLPADGRLTPETIAALQAALGGQQSETIKAFQTTLSELGWYSGPIDGAYGPVTAEAVAGLQAQLGVTPDGILGPETFAAFQSQCQPDPTPCERPETPATTVAATAAPTDAPTVAPTEAPTTAPTEPPAQTEVQLEIDDGTSLAFVVVSCASPDPGSITLQAQTPDDENPVVLDVAVVGGTGGIALSGGDQREGTVDALVVDDTGSFEASGTIAIADDTASGPSDFTLTGQCT